uniref:BFA1 n=1 Tax=Arabidopsis thaliana TaxID=3702 RepID=UPI000E115703|nr:Chain A, BFA1 [Arabidopsis thaliana]5YVF_B Chain B, BFA1 [Arabidopsis thaliana]5YVF_C Chain C, BFA1 [Arabidopsis thaliana]5YVF_D Chain D, BFA1 [Arabidopsis thaliana]
MGSMTVQEDDKRTSDESMSIDNLRGFVDLNVGKWTGSFHQFDGNGNLLHKIDTRLSASSYGEDELLSLNQSLYIKQPTSATSVSEEEEEEPEWVEYKIKETNMFTVDKYQQIGFFPKERAFSLRYQTAGMLDTTLRQGVLGEDDTGEESPRNLKLPSRRPSLVCENCLYSKEIDRRARAFHIMDPKGVLEMLIVFLEERGLENLAHPVLDNAQNDAERINPFLGTWKGRSVTKRSGVYGATLSEADTVAVLEMNDKGQVVQDISSTSDEKKVTTNVHWEGKMSKDLVTFAEGYQMTLLPGGMYMGCPCDVSKCVADLKSFHLEFCWLESPSSRQRLIRTYDHEGLAVSSTYFTETKMKLAAALEHHHHHH